MKDNLETGRSGKKRTVAVGASVIAGVIAGGGALLLGPGSASAQPTAEKTVTAAQPAAPTALVAKAVAIKAVVQKKHVAAAATEDSQQTALDAYFAAGYTYDDAVALAKTWKTADIFEVKAAAGKKLEAGETLPIKPGSASPEAPPAATKDDAAVNKFFAAGYTYDDAVKLAKLWGSADPYHAKITAGHKLLDGHTLPVAR